MPIRDNPGGDGSLASGEDIASLTTTVGVMKRHCDSRAGVVGRHVNADAFPHYKTICDIVAKVHVLWERVVFRSRRIRSPHVVLIGHVGLGVGGIGVDCLDRATQGLVEEQLPNVACRTTREGTVGQLSTVNVSQHVSVSSTAVVVAGKQRVELDDALAVGDLDATKESGVQTAFTRVGDTAVDACGIAVPDVHKQWTGDLLASADIDELKLEMNRDAA